MIREQNELTHTTSLTFPVDNDDDDDNDEYEMIMTLSHSACTQNSSITKTWGIHKILSNLPFMETEVKGKNSTNKETFTQIICQKMN